METKMIKMIIIMDIMIISMMMTKVWDSKCVKTNTLCKSKLSRLTFSQYVANQQATMQDMYR